LIDLYGSNNSQATLLDERTSALRDVYKSVAGELSDPGFSDLDEEHTVFQKTVLERLSSITSHAQHKETAMKKYVDSTVKNAMARQGIRS
jgi:hypothetical protein